MDIQMPGTAGAHSGKTSPRRDQAHPAGWQTQLALGVTDDHTISGIAIKTPPGIAERMAPGPIEILAPDTQDTTVQVGKRL